MLPEPVEPVAEPEPEVVEKPPENRKRWYVVKVQSGREDTIKEAIERRVKKERLDEFYGQIIIPVEKVTEVKTDKNGKRVTKTKERKLYPGYLMCEVEYNDRILYLFRETSGVGDFVGAQPGNLDRPPTPMSDREIQRMLGPTHDPAAAATPPPPPKYVETGERVRVVDGTFNGMEGVVKAVLEAVSKVQVELTIFGRPVAVDLEYYQVEQA
jgi:transcriptional antiterminator NusG